jgi:hypothetical protein
MSDAPMPPRMQAPMQIPVDTAADGTRSLCVFWSYPLRYGALLTNHEWVPLYTKRLLGSDFVAHAIAGNRRADGFTAVLLWAASFDQNPAGTLPDDDVALARLAGFGADVAGWQAHRAFALWGWSTVHVEGDERERPRLGHPLIAEIAVFAHKRKAGRDQANAAGRIHQLRSRVRAKLRLLKREKLAENQFIVDSVADWLTTANLPTTPENVAQALDAVAGVPRVVRGVGDG